MMTDFGMLSRMVLSMSLILLCLCAFSLLAVKPDTAQYVVVMMAIWINVGLSGTLLITTIWRKRKSAKQNVEE